METSFKRKDEEDLFIRLSVNTIRDRLGWSIAILAEQSAGNLDSEAVRYLADTKDAMKRMCTLIDC